MVWCGDHKQTPGGLRKTDEAKAFRRKLLRRPIALRGDTKHLQPNMLGKVVLIFFWLVAAWVKSRAERPSVSVVNRQLHVQIGCKLGIRNRKDIRQGGSQVSGRDG